MEKSITIEFYTGKDPLTFTGLNSYVAENLIIDSCKYLEIGPVARHLFGLWSPTDCLWFSSNFEFELENGNSLSLYLRLRFRPPSIKSLIDKTDSVTHNYYFHQAHSDFIEGRIPELCNQQMRESALGLVATDIIRVMLETKMTPDTMKYNSKNFIPQMLKKNPVWDNFLRDPLLKAVNRGWMNSRQNPDFVKEKYLQTLYELVPDYGSERYSVLVDDSGKIYQVDLVVNPYHSEYPGLRMRVQKRKCPWTHVCSIEELCYVSMRNDQTVEISRQNGVPQYVQFCDKVHMHSFVSLLDGYYRLTEKWTFNLCKDLTTPSLTHLKSMKCHGPIGAVFSRKKLEEKSNNEDGCYLIRESEFAYDEFYVDVWTSTKDIKSDNVTVYSIKKDNENSYVLNGWNEGFESITQLLTHHATYNNMDFSRCIPPSEYDKSNLLLCRKENQDGHSPVTRGDCSCSAQCIPHDAIAYSKNAARLLGKFTIVTQGSLRRSCTDSPAVAVKMLRKETKITHLQEFLSQSDKILYWQHDNIVSTLGMILTNPTALVMEWLPLGTLDKYLDTHRQDMQEVDLIEAAFYIARALWYLEDQQTCHGNIRCHNILVAAHTDSSFVVKLSDPGVIAYSDLDLHWIPPECYNNYSLASRSILADVYAFGTTLWEIFSFGAKPKITLSAKELKEWYLRGHTLAFPTDWHKDMKKVISECWLRDQDNRKRPQAIVRDVNQNLYEVYNSRRGHSYATIDANAIPVQEESSSRPPLPVSRPPLKKQPMSKLKSIFKLPVSVPIKGFSYNSLSQSKSTLITNTTSSANSTTSFLTDDKVSIDPMCNSDISLSDISDPEPFQFYPRNSSGDISWVIEKEHLKLKGKIGEGFYGEVSIGTLNYNGFVDQMVAVKRVKMIDQSPICINEFNREMDIMKTLQHKNIVRIIGVVEDPETMIVMEYVDNGSLLNHLQCTKNLKPQLDFSELLHFSLGIAEGMEYLETQSIVHRDLAARNVLVGSNSEIKISDFGLAQVIKDHYYRMKTERNLPVRWYAIEAIIGRKFSHKSDVWSYGIVLWEIFSHGDNPQIPDVPDISLHEALQRGQRLRIPNGCPSRIYSLMRRCWDKDSHERPTFSEMILTLEDIKLELCS